MLSHSHGVDRRQFLEATAGGVRGSPFEGRGLAAGGADQPSPTRYFDPYADAEIPPPVAGAQSAGFARFPMTPDTPFGDFGVDHAVRSRRHYYASIAFIDDRIGRIVAALTDARGKYVFTFFTGAEQLFDLAADPRETRDVSGEPARGAALAAWRDRMARHLAERGDAWVKDGRIQTRPRGIIYGPDYPKDKASS